MSVYAHKFYDFVGMDKEVQLSQDCMDSNYDRLLDGRRPMLLILIISQKVQKNLGVIQEFFQ